MDKTWVEFIELGLKIIAVVGAGVWTVVLVPLLRQRERAMVSLRKSEAQLRDLELKATAMVLVDIQPSSHRSPDGKDYIIAAVVTLTNPGGQNTRVKWKGEPPPFSVRLVKFNDAGEAEFAPPKELRVLRTLDPTSDALSHVVRAGAIESMSFALRVSVPGLYYLSFRGVVGERDRAEAKKLGVELPTAWTCNRYVFVGDPQAPSTNEAAERAERARSMLGDVPVTMSRCP
jgi:hypothetical protein